jgi:uncharacterized protein YbjQ (UPF0145 family)
MLLSTSHEIQGVKIKGQLGIVSGSFIQKTTCADRIKHCILGKTVNKVSTARKHAITKMLGRAGRMDADAIISIRFTTTQVGKYTEVHVYGTAVQCAGTKIK